MRRQLKTKIYSPFLFLFSTATWYCTSQCFKTMTSVTLYKYRIHFTFAIVMTRIIMLFTFPCYILAWLWANGWKANSLMVKQDAFINKFQRHELNAAFLPYGTVECEKIGLSSSFQDIASRSTNTKRFKCNCRNPCPAKPKIHVDGNNIIQPCYFPQVQIALHAEEDSKIPDTAYLLRSHLRKRTAPKH